MPVTHLGTISLSPRVSPDNDRIAFASLGRQGWSIRMFSLVLGRMVSFPSTAGTTLSPAWSSDGAKLAFSGSRSGDPEIFTSDARRRQRKASHDLPRTRCFAYLEP